MTRIRRQRAALFLAVAVLAPFAQAPFAQAWAAGCASAGAAPLTVGTVAPVAPGGQRNFTLTLGVREGVIVDLVALAPKPAADEDEHDGADKALPHAIKLCDAQGNVLAPQPGEVFAKGGSVTATEDGERLRFYATAAGPYLISVAADDEPREILVRRREGGTIQAPVVSAMLGKPQKGIASSTAPMVFSFTGTAGQWVELKATSEKDTLLRLAAPDREGTYSVVAENDDSDGLNPMIRRKLPVAGTYFVQVDSLADEPAEFELALNRTDAPKPPPPPAPLRVGTEVSGKLADGDAVTIYALPVVAGHAYRLELTAAYDGVVAIGVPNPVEPDDGGSGPDAGFTEIKSQDSGTSGTEKLNFAARSSGQLMVRVKSFGIGETDGAYTLKAVDLGG
ncbi:MAG: PPC domain-containing protein [Sphingomonadales bacterium]|nr:PPC domain-containing protein [Sphingomonadales bacterium]